MLHRRHLALDYRDRIEHFVEQANHHHPTIKFTAEFPIRKQHSWTPASTKGKDSKETQSLMCALISSQLRHFSIPILLPVTRKELKKGFIKEEALRLLRTNSSKKIFEEKITNFKAPWGRGWFHFRRGILLPP